MSFFRDMREIRQAQWNAQPKWAKRYALFIGLPAWLFLVIYQVSDLTFSELGYKIAVGLFVSAAFVQLGCFFRSSWRMDI